MKFILTVIFILTSGERVVDTAYTTSPGFCEATADMYQRIGNEVKKVPGSQFQEVIAFCRSERDERDV